MTTKVKEKEIKLEVIYLLLIKSNEDDRVVYSFIP